MYKIFEVNEKHRNEAGKYETHKRESKELNNLSGNLGFFCNLIGNWVKIYQLTVFIILINCGGVSY